MQRTPSVHLALTILCLGGCGGSSTQSALPDLDDFSASRDEIAAYMPGISDVMNYYGERSASCLPAIKNRGKVEFDGTTFQDLADFYARNSGRLYKKNEDGKSVRKKKRTAAEFIEVFGWADRLDQSIPDSGICLPSIEVYQRMGPLPKDYVRRKIQARKRGVAIRAIVAKDLEKLPTPEEDGLYLVIIDEDEQKSLDAQVFLQEDSRLTFIRLTLLAGG